ncbi:ATP-binding protein [Vulgatibacter incomptus]|uniref:ATPase n=1 Tax=Vulgatibacter incomptus TaxID=1391653 RepID=A0A0K1P8G4_9BACT|nr:ATP-binding protein [Vulgatibacter incomptus]AKU89810.1 hypothetical protein AKJ08_0197 [Vulgatibacter incomptus]
MEAESLVPRFAGPRLVEALGDSPVVLVHGPRQCGKTTLSKTVGEPRGYGYLSFDDDRLRASAEADPVSFVADLPERVILDEVQRVPGLFTSLKAEVDRRRVPGRFLITGSANVLLVPRLADSLAGRLEILRLHPLSQSEIGGARSDFLDQLFAGSFARNRPFDRMGIGLAERVAGGGYPSALARRSPGRRATWYRDYLEAVVQRDVRDLARIGSLDALPRLLAVAASQTARLFNITELAGSFELSRPTIRDYITLLERVFLLEHLPAWHGNRLARLVKTPKLHIGDTGLASALLGLDAQALYEDRETYGQLVETFAYQELRREASFRDDDIRFFHYRDHNQMEVDVVLERAGKVAGVEVKSASVVSAADFRGLKRLAEAAGKRFVAGVVLYDGDHVLPFGERLYAVPITALWRTS